jgi:drug/metabolite transporter (DMT)-like permease
MRSRDAVAVVAALSGMALFFVGKLDTRGMAGNGMALLSSFFFAMLILMLRRENDAAQSAVTWGNLALALILLPFVRHDLALTGTSMLVLIALGIFQIGLAYAFFVRGLKYVTATQAGLIGMIEPIANPIWVFLILGERPTPYAIAGALIVLAAIGWHTITAAPATDMPPPD